MCAKPANSKKDASNNDPVIKRDSLRQTEELKQKLDRQRVLNGDVEKESSGGYAEDTDANLDQAALPPKKLDTVGVVEDIPTEAAEELSESNDEKDAFCDEKHEMPQEVDDSPTKPPTQFFSLEEDDEADFSGGQNGSFSKFWFLIVVVALIGGFLLASALLTLSVSHEDDVRPVRLPNGNVQVPQGNPACWKDGFTFGFCCASAHGPAGNPKCWDQVHNYGKCCISNSEL